MKDSTVIVAPANQPSQRDDSPRASRVTRLKAGLAIGFGIPFALGIAYQFCSLFGWSVDFSGIRLFVELGVLGALLMLTLQYEKLPLGSLGVHKLRADEVYLGLTAGLALIVLSGAVAALLPHRGAAGSGGFASLVRAMAPADSSGLSQAPIWLALLVIVASVFAEELAARGYAIRRLRAITGTTALAAAAALAIDIVARIPLWGLRYTIVVLPAEIVLVALYVWRRQLMTCIVAHLTLILPIFLAVHFVGPATTGRSASTEESANGHLDEEMAVVELRRALGQSTGPGSAAAERAQSHYAKHDFAHAQEQIDDAIRAEPKNRAYIGMRAAIHSAQGDREGAIADYTAMLALDPKDPNLYRARATEYKFARDFRPATADLETAIKLAPKDSRNFAERASLHFGQQQYSAAIADFDAAIALDPANRHYVVERALIYEHTGQHALALADCDRLVSSDPARPDGYECRINVYAMSGDLKAAMVNLDLAIPRDPDNPELYSIRGKLEMEAGQWRQAHSDYEKVARLKPDNPQICDPIAWTLATSASDEVRDGKAALVLATHENELTGYSRGKYLETLAAAYAETGDFSSAVKWQHAALRANDVTADEIQSRRDLLEVFQRGRAWRETSTTAYESRPTVTVMVGVVIVFTLAAVGMVALLYWSARWSLRRAKRTPPVAAA